MKKTIFTVCLLLLPFTHAFGAEPLNKIVAIVNGEMITAFELQMAATSDIMKSRLNPRNPADKDKIDAILRATLDNMVTDLIVVSEAQRLKITAAEAEVEAEIKRIVDNSKLSEEDFFKQASSQGVTRELMKDRLTKRIISQRLMANMVGRKIIVPKEEVEKYYAQHGGIVTGKSVEFALIIYPPKQNPAPWADSIKAGRISFGEAASRISAGPGRENGGKIGTIMWDDLEQHWKDRFKNMQPGEVSDIFALDKMKAQVKLLSKNEGQKPASLKEAYEGIEEAIRAPKLEERYKDYLAELRKKARIEIRM